MDVGAWLRGLGLEKYTEAFAENGVDAALLPEITNEDLKDLGIVRLTDRKRLLKAISGFVAGDGPSDTEPVQLLTAAGERRQVTVLFADLTGFTHLSKELGAEATHALLNRYFETVDGIVTGYGGTIDKHMGDNAIQYRNQLFLEHPLIDFRSSPSFGHSGQGRECLKLTLSGHEQMRQSAEYVIDFVSTSLLKILREAPPDGS